MKVLIVCSFFLESVYVCENMLIYFQILTYLDLLPIFLEAGSMVTLKLIKFVMVNSYGYIYIYILDLTACSCIL